MKRWAIVAMLSGFALAAYAEETGTDKNPPEVEPCGEVLKEKAQIPQKASELNQTIQEYMDLHGKWVGKSKSKEAKAEASAVGKLAKAHKELAQNLKKVADAMAASERMPTAEHDKTNMDPKMSDLMKRWIERERELAALLTKDAQSMEDMMKANASAAAQ